MTDTQTPDPRAWVRYDSDEAAPVQLPGYLNALPSIVTPGVVVELDREYLDEVTARGESTRFVVVDEPVAAPSPNEKLTKEQLAEKLGDPDLAKDPKPALVELADELDRMTPPIPEQSNAGEGELSPFDQAVADAAASDDVDPDAVADDETKGAGQ